MTLRAVLEQPHAIGALRAAVRNQSIHHAYLFGGPDGVGKELAAIGFAQTLLCSEMQGAGDGDAIDGCGECATCRRIERHSHPDVTWVMPEEEQIARKLAGRSDFSHAPSRDIRVEQIRALQERLSYRARRVHPSSPHMPTIRAPQPKKRHRFFAPHHFG